MRAIRRSLMVWVAAAGIFAGIPASAEVGVTATTIKIGSYGPLTGPAAFLGLGSRAGVELAVQEVNDAGGIHGRKLELLFEDDANSPAKALAAVKKLIEQDEAFLIFGLSGSNATVGTLDYVKRLKVPNYFAVASAPQVTRPFNRYMFRGAGNESERYGEVYSEFFAEHLKIKRISILSGSDENAKNEADNTSRFLERRYGIKPLMRAEFKIGDRDFTPQLLQAKASDPELLMVAGQTPETSIIIRQARELGMKQPIYAGAAAVDPALIVNTGQNAEGVMGPWPLPLFPDSDEPDMVKFREAWAKRNPNAPKGRPNLFDLYAYGDLYVLAEAMRRAGPDLTREKFVDALENLNGYRVSAVATPRSYTNYHHIGNFRISILTVRGQRWIPIDWEPKRESEIIAEFKK